MDAASAGVFENAIHDSNQLERGNEAEASEQELKHSNSIDRHVHQLYIPRLTDIIHLSLLRRDFARAQRAFAILARIPSGRPREAWLYSYFTTLPPRKRRLHARRAYFQYFDYRMPIYSRIDVFRLYIDTLIRNNRHDHALQELETFLSSPPYTDSLHLHIYAAMLAVYISNTNQRATGANVNTDGDNDDDDDGEDGDGDVPTTTSTNHVFNSPKAFNFIKRALQISPDDPFANQFAQLIQQNTNDQTQDPKQT